MMHPTHVMGIEPPAESAVGSGWMFASIAPGQHERNDYQDRQPYYQANH
ncbi:hypothetical protein [Caballeronia glebae]